MLLESSRTPEETRTLVRQAYAAIASQSADDGGCGCGCAPKQTASLVGDAYLTVDGYVPDADLGLGCGLPTHLAGIGQGDTVLDLGSGAGLDAFVARSLVGEDGAVYGVDMTPEMVARARENAEKMGFANVRFFLGEIEALPIQDASIDVVISNCVLNLVPVKAPAFAEMYRVLRPGGGYCISDLVTVGTLPPAVRQSAEAYAGCIAGALDRDDYLALLIDQGFEDVAVREERAIVLPGNLLTPAEAEAYAAFASSGGAILSITVTGRRPA